MYQTSEPEKPYYAPLMCEGCGVRLMPNEPSDPEEADFSARSVCAECYERGPHRQARFDGATGQALS